MDKISEFECVILAGGKSQRMGRNKALLPFGGEESLLAFQYKKMCEIFSKVFISCKKNSDIRSLEVLFENNLQEQCLQEESTFFSPLVGIVNAFGLIKSKGIFFISVDTPFINYKTIQEICAIKGDYDIIYPKTSQKSHYLSALWKESCVLNAYKALNMNNYKLGNLILDFKSFCLECKNELEFANLNSPKDYQEALRRFKEQNG